MNENTDNTGAANVAVTNTATATTTATTLKEKVKGRKPRLVDYVNKFVQKHGTSGKHGMRFNSEKGLKDIDAAIAILTSLKATVVIPVVPVVAPAAPVVAPVAAPVAENAAPVAAPVAAEANS